MFLQIVIMLLSLVLAAILGDETLAHSLIKKCMI